MKTIKELIKCCKAGTPMVYVPESTKIIFPIMGVEVIPEDYAPDKLIRLMCIENGEIDLKLAYVHEIEEAEKYYYNSDKKDFVVPEGGSASKDSMAEPKPNTIKNN
jgi:hypothetical protein